MTPTSQDRHAAVNAFANRVAKYVTEEGDPEWSPYRCAVEAVTVAMQDAWYEVEAIGSPAAAPTPSPDRPAGASPVPERPDPTRLAIAQATTQRGWHFAPTADIVHVDGCDCEQADAWTMEMDPRCSTGPEHTAVTLDDGAYTQWVIDLDAFAAAVEQTRDWDDTAEAVLVTRDGPCIPLAFIDPAPVPPDLRAYEDAWNAAYWSRVDDVRTIGDASPTVLIKLSDEELGRIAFEAFFADPYATSWPRAARAVRDALAEKEADR